MNTPRQTVAAALTLLLVAGLTLRSAAQQAAPIPAPVAPVAPVAPIPTESAAAPRTSEKDLEQRRARENGITVEAPKIYDDAILQQMLRAAEARLAATQVIDQAGIAGRIGTLAGATQRISGFGLNVQTPSVPGVATTNRGATSTTVETSTAAVGADGRPTSTDVEQRTRGAAAEDAVTTAPAMAPPVLITPAASTTLPTTAGVAATDVLNEQMQLTYEIANLRLLLEGALSDHVMVIDGKNYAKPRATLGFPITIDPHKRFKDAVAVVEVEIAPPPKAYDGESMSVTALLPREKTYNVAAITDSTTSIGGGLATSVIGVSGSWLRGHKTYYVTQDQDTVALAYTPETPGHIGFRWQFRPVLGKPTVRSGLKQTFVQIAFPTAMSAPVYGAATIRTYWVKYDKKRGTLGEVVTDSLAEMAAIPIKRQPLAVDPFEFNNAQLQDLGGGQMLVTVPGRFLSGTYVRIGSTLVRDGTANALFEHFAIKFTAAIADLATKEVALVARDGREKPLTIQSSLPALSKASVEGLDDNSVLLTVDFASAIDKLLPSPVIVIGGRVFGYKDAPVERKDKQLKAVVPLSLMAANPSVVVKSLFAPTQQPIDVDGLNRLSRPERLVLLEQGRDSSRFLLYGSRMAQLKVVEPKEAKLETLPSGGQDTLQLLTIPTVQMKSHKQLVLQRGTERPFLLAMPGAIRAPSVKARERVGLGTDVALFEADSTDGFKSASWRKNVLTVERIDGKTLRVSGLKDATSSLTTQIIDFAFDSGDTSATLEIVNTRVESVAK